ncbi:MAG TPA: PEP-CTERM sorting domain-containing protein [Fimbriimonas sp.]|nr:PEP-CTERM sorting domain-containing protein [Fimbriimonas sp.]
MSTWKIATVAGLVGLTVSANATFYTSEAAFLAAIDPTFYLEDFSSFTFGSPLDGTQTSWNAPGGNGYGWTASAVQGLWSNTSALSTNVANDPIVISFTGLPVTAFGGFLNNTDIGGSSQGGTVTMLMSNGDTLTVNDGTFLGWVGSTAVSSATITAAGVGLDWGQLDHAYTGEIATSVPEPASMAALGLGAIALLRRRKSAKK